MAGLCWMAMVLFSFLSPKNCMAAVDKDWLTSIVQGVNSGYQLGNTFSWAVNIPQNQDPSSLTEVLQNDPADKVNEGVSQGGVYQGTRLVAAAQSGTLSQVLEKIQPFIKSSEGNTLIIYSEDYPSENNGDISGQINNIIQNWNSFAFVFHNVADVPGADITQKAESFKQKLSNVGLENQFRCYEPGGSFQCISCNSNNDVTPSCLSDTVPSNAEQNTGSENTTPEQANTGTGQGLDEGTSAGLDQISDTSVGGQTSGQGGKVRKGGKRGKGGRIRKGRRRGKGGRIRKGRKRGRGGRMRKGRKRGKGRKSRKGRKRGKGRKSRKGRKRGKGRKSRKGRKRGRGRRSRKGGKRRKYGE